MATTARSYLKIATGQLRASSISTPRLDSLLLMEYILNVDRSIILANLDIELSTQQKNVLNSLLKQRAKHIPIAQITHRCEFYGRHFFVNKWVLQPRPESETMIDLFKELSSQLYTAGRLHVADVGTGCGAIGITACLESKNTTVELIDIDVRALNCVKRNVVIHTISTKIIKADLLPAENVVYDILLCNLPYVPDDFHINRAASHEPEVAIFGGKDGLEIYRKLFKLLSIRQQKPLYLLCESLPPSHRQMTTEASLAGYKLVKTSDFIQLFSLNTL